MEFVAKRKTVKIQVDGATHEMVVPSVGQSEELFEALKNKGGVEVFHAYDAFFKKLGLQINLSEHLDAQDYNDFIAFILTPKKKD